MPENFANTYQTTLNDAGGISAGDGSMIVTSATGSPAVNFRVKIDSELILVTAKSGTTFTITRGIEGTTAASHSDGATVTHVLTARSLFLVPRVPTLLQSVKASADTPDDDFDGTALDGKWTVVDGSSGTVTLLAGSGAGVYDLASRPGWLLMQMGTAVGDGVALRQDYTLPDGNCIVAYLSFAADVAVAATQNEQWFGIGVNDNDTQFDAGAAGQTASIIWDTETGGYRVIGFDGSSPIGQSYGALAEWGTAGFGAFFRIDRVGLVYNLYWSHDGFSWAFIGSKTMSTAANNLWLIAEVNATMANRMVVGVPWFRQGTAGAVDPWPLTLPD